MSLLDRLIFQPKRGRRIRDPRDFGAEDVFFEAADGTRLHALWLAAAPEIDRAVLVLHGNTGDASRRLPRASRIRALGAHVLVPDYRGYGRSEGRPSEAGVYADARAALEYLSAKRGIEGRRVVAFGRSLGGAIAVDLAQDEALAGLVLESTFPSVAAIARSYLGVGFEFWLGSKLASAEKIGRVRSPLLMFHGDRDRVIRPALGRALYAMAPEPKTFHPIAGARHHDTERFGGDEYTAHWRSFLDWTAPLASRGGAA